MSNPDNAATQKDDKAGASFETKVNDALANIEIDKESGKAKLPEGLSEEVSFAVKAELRRRDTVSAFTKSQQELRAHQAELEVLRKRQAKPVLDLTEEQKEELEELRDSNPQAWREKLNALEAEALEKAKLDYEAALADATGKITKETRTQQLANALKTEAIDLTVEQLMDEVPPRYVKQFEAGEVEIKDFIKSIKPFIGAQGTTTENPNDKLSSQPDLGNVGGSGTQSSEAQSHQEPKTYENTVF